MIKNLLLCGLFALVTKPPLIHGDESFPIVPDDIEVTLFARDPLVRNPCAIAFDARGRLCVGMGPQYRSPTPDTAGDSVWILVDEDADGKAERRKRFATGFNSIQGLAWKGRDLWVGNSPDMTIVRDLDGDDEADEYVRLWTDLGNLEHGLHGLNWAPDGRLYMSKGNSKGLTRLPDRIAPRPFRELWGMDSPDLPETLSPVVFEKGHYEKNYHNPSDDWGVHGGVLRCEDGGKNLEIFSRGFRNPWDITFDDGFNWLGTDNDQTQGDKIFSPFFGAHFGWGHTWSYDWKGDGHLPTAPANGPLFEGSGTGVIFCGLERYPEKYRGVFLVNDWLRREIYLYRPSWRGAHLVPEGETFELLAHAGGGRSMDGSRGRKFDPVDIEIGPDGAIYISSWGREYGVKYIDGKIANEGRIYRLWPRAAPPMKWDAARRSRPASAWTVSELVEDLGSHLPVWRTNAQEELIRRGDAVVELLMSVLGKTPEIPRALETWIAWTLGRIRPGDRAIDGFFVASNRGSLNRRLQAIRILGHRGARSALVRHLTDPEPRVRFETVLAVRQSNSTTAPDRKQWADRITRLVADESDRHVYYAAWHALRDLLPVDELRRLLADEHPAVRRAALLALLEDDVLNATEVRLMAADSDAANAALATRWLGGKPEFVIKGQPLRGSSRGKEDAEDTSLPAVSFIRKLESLGGPDASYQVATLQLGTRAYGDRGYHFTEIPDEFDRETFIRTANDDADSGARLKFHVDYESDVYLAHDLRIPRIPSWLEEFSRTDLHVATNDTRFRLYSRKFPTGEVILGPNDDDERRGGRSHYFVIVRPKMLEPPTKPVTPTEVLPLLGKANKDRGRDLFQSKHGAGCHKCHALEGVGNVFAPALAGIATRVDGEFVVRSMLEPSAAITEGFVTQVFTMQDGDVHSGIVLQETGQAIKLVAADGVVVTLPRKSIADRQGTKTSAMPEFAETLRARDVADLTAYVLSTKASPPE